MCIRDRDKAFAFIKQNMQGEIGLWGETEVLDQLKNWALSQKPAPTPTQMCIRDRRRDMPKWPMIKSPRIWISWWQGDLKTGHLPIRIPVSRSLASSPPMEVSTDFIESEKVGRQAVSGRIFLLRSVFRPKTFSLSRLYNGRRRQRKQATDGKVGTKNKRETAYCPVSYTHLRIA